MTNKPKTNQDIKEGFPPKVTFKVGRPTEYDGEKPSELLEICSEGKHYLSACKKWGISEKTFFLWKKTHKEFKEALGIAYTAYKAHWIEQGWENVDNKDYNNKLFQFMKINYNEAISEYSKVDQTLGNPKDEKGKSEPFVVKVFKGEDKF